MFQKALVAVLMFAASTFVAVAAPTDEPTLQQVYQAAESGRLNDAQAMMDKVLRDHPNSAKAHFVEAEILGKQGRFDAADTELRTAQRLEPGLAFAKPQAVENLKARIAAARNPGQPAQHARVQQPQPESGLPWGLILFGVALIGAIIFFARAMSRRPTVIPAGYGPGGTMQPYGGGMAPPMGPMPMGGGMAGGGIGSGIVGGLATGAAIGAGMVAGEALMHHFTDGERTQGNVAPPPAGNFDALPNDMGGSDFGVSDGGSWDDSSGGGGSDWG